VLFLAPVLFAVAPLALAFEPLVEPEDFAEVPDRVGEV
jgi:hypothetical protein